MDRFTRKTMKTIKIKHYSDLEIKNQNLKRVILHLLDQLGDFEWNVDGEVVRFIKVKR